MCVYVDTYALYTLRVNRILSLVGCQAIFCKRAIKINLIRNKHTLNIVIFDTLDNVSFIIQLHGCVDLSLSELLMLNSL